MDRICWDLFGTKPAKMRELFEEKQDKKGTKRKRFKACTTLRRNFR
jgi:hypothetical protein